MQVQGGTMDCREAFSQLIRGTQIEGRNNIDFLEAVLRLLEEHKKKLEDTLHATVDSLRRDTDAELKMQHARIEELKSKSEEDAMLWGQTHVSMVTGELLKQFFHQYFPKDSSRTCPKKPRNWFWDVQSDPRILALEKKMALKEGYFAYMADVVIAKRDATAHLDDPKVQVDILIGKAKAPTSCPQEIPKAQKATRIKQCLDLFERYPKLKRKDMCKYEWCFLKHHELLT